MSEPCLNYFILSCAGTIFLIQFHPARDCFKEQANLINCLPN